MGQMSVIVLPAHVYHKLGSLMRNHALAGEPRPLTACVGYRTMQQLTSCILKEEGLQ
jgi:hypothetical protein